MRSRPQSCNALKIWKQWSYVDELLYRLQEFKEGTKWIPHLKSPVLDSITQRVGVRGLSNAKIFHLALVAPLNLADRLQKEVFVNWSHEKLLESEFRRQTARTVNCYIRLMEIAIKRNQQDSFVSRAAAVLVEFLIRGFEGPYPGEIWLPGELCISSHEHWLAQLVKDLQTMFTGSEVAFDAIMSLKPLYDAQGRKERFEQIEGRLKLHRDPHAKASSTTLKADPQAQSFDFHGTTDVLGWTDACYKAVNDRDVVSDDWFAALGQLLQRNATDPVVQTLLDVWLSKLRITL